MTRRYLRTGTSLATLLFASLVSVAAAQVAVTITPTLNPLPIGFCGAVQIGLVDQSGNARPRNALGFLMTLADFDMSVTSSDPRAVVGQQIDASHWSVCACQAGVPGAVATITASYPANRLAANARVVGVASPTTTTITLAASKGSVDPTGCGSPAPAAIAAGAPGTPVQQAPSAKTVATAPTTSGVLAAAQGGPVSPKQITTTQLQMMGYPSPPPATAAQPVKPTTIATTQLHLIGYPAPPPKAPAGPVKPVTVTTMLLQMVGYILPN